MKKRKQPSSPLPCSKFKKRPPPNIQWSPSQQKVIDTLTKFETSHKNLLIIGEAGTGKSFLLKHILKHILPKKTTYAIAPTGFAAMHIRGTTLHHFAGTGPDMDTLHRDELVAKVYRRADARKRWKQVTHLVLDECSMVHARTFDTLEYLARQMRPTHSSQFFGGIRLILCGDVMQLPPVTKEKDQKKPLFIFESDCWSRGAMEVVVLNTCFRQNQDSPFLQVLREVRRGEWTELGKNLILPRVRANLSSGSSPSLGVEPTKIFCHRHSVELENQKKFQSLTEPIQDYQAVEQGYQAAMLMKDCPALEHLQLRVGAQVILIKNMFQTSKSLCNGARGIVVGFETAPPDNTDNKKTTTKFTNDQYPIVEFLSGNRFTIPPALWKLESGGKVVASRQQIPLILGWAITVHRCQGMTLDLAEMDLAQVFEYGQAYVALSRMRSLEGLSLSSFNQKCIRAHPRALEFIKQHCLVK